MYQQHFGLARPFSGDGIPQDEALFRTRATETLITELAVALNRKDSVAVLFGNSGTGKSAIAHAVLKDLSTRLAFAALSLRTLTPPELLEQILCDFGYAAFGKGHVECRQIWRQFICEAAATDTRVCLLVEDTESLDTDMLKALHQLTAADALLSPGCNVILTANRDPAGELAAPALAALSQRVRLRRRIEPLSAGEIDSYIEFKCSQARIRREQLFTPDVAAVVYERTGGIIRVIDNLLESALSLAASNHAPAVTADCIAEVADTQFGLRQLSQEQVDRLLQDFDAPSAITGRDGCLIPTLIEYVPDRALTEESLALADKPLRQLRHC